VTIVLGSEACKRSRPIGLDIAKSVFQVHGFEATGHVAIRRQLKRRYVLAFFEKLPLCVVGIEACAPSHPAEERCLGSSPALDATVSRTARCRR
jgi:transposase